MAEHHALISGPIQGYVDEHGNVCIADLMNDLIAVTKIAGKSLDDLKEALEDRWPHVKVINMNKPARSA